MGSCEKTSYVELFIPSFKLNYWEMAKSTFLLLYIFFISCIFLRK